jgi:VIT1/CCC1 family predicted Fe2+/Mn2+ transporter
MTVSHPNEAHHESFASRLNWLRAGVLGANDGIVSIAALVVGVAAATNELGPLLVAGISGVIAGAISMAAGEYVSVSSQRDSERSLIQKEKQELIHQPEVELQELQEIYQKRGLSESTAKLVAKELTTRNAFVAHLDAELRITEQTLTNPWQAALSSALSFLAGAILPMAAVVVAPEQWRIAATVVASLVALGITGAVGARLGKAPALVPTTRVIVGGALALAVTWGIGSLLGAGLGV